MPNPNVLFKRGTQANFNANISSTAQDGVFYLTEDTNRLYVGQRTSTATNAAVKLVELNKSITVVDVVKNPTGNQTALPTTGVEVGQFYYVKGTNLHNGEQDNNGNILCIVDRIENGVPHWT